MSGIFNKKKIIFLLLTIFVFINNTKSLAFDNLLIEDDTKNIEKNITDEKNAKIVNEIAAIVNGNIITSYQLDNAIKTYYLFHKKNKINILMIQKNILKNLILLEIYTQIAITKNIIATKIDIKNMIENIAKKNNLSSIDMINLIKKNGINYNLYKENLRKQILMFKLEQKISNTIIIKPYEINLYLQNLINKCIPNNNLYLISHILISFSKNQSNENKKQLYHKSKFIFENIKNNNISFFNAAKKYSDSIDSSSGGFLSWKKLDEFPQDFIPILNKMQIGSIYGPFKIGKGFHILKLIAKKKIYPISYLYNEYYIQKTIIPIDSGKELQKIFYKSISQYNKKLSSNKKIKKITYWISINNINKKILNIINNLKVGEISQPLKVNNYWIIIKLLKIKSKDVDLNFLKNQSIKDIFQKKLFNSLKEWNIKIQNDSYIKILKPSLI